LARDAELCNECGGTDLTQASDGIALLLGLAEDRPVAFELHASGPTTVGRGSGSSEAPDIDLSRFPGSDSVHRRHAALEQREGHWRIVHLGRNPLVIQRTNDAVVVEPGTNAALLPDDWLQFGRVRLRLVTNPTGAHTLER
jgi:hypothetical protein